LEVDTKNSRHLAVFIIFFLSQNLATKLRDNVRDKSSRTEIGHTNTGGCSEVGFVSHITVAAEGSNAVDALTVMTKIWQHLALIDV